jgi:menaquinol-cytochrome c reductase iron-sulfur subunit
MSMQGNERPDLPGRRDFLSIIGLGLGALIGAAVTLPVVGFVLAPLLRKSPEIWRSVGSADSFEVGKTVEVTIEDSSSLPWAGVTAKTGVWLRRDNSSRFTAFSLNCSHLGCPVRWVADANLFMCPCHGGVYYADGAVAAGPPPRGLTRYPVRVRAGQVQIRTTPIPIT